MTLRRLLRMYREKNRRDGELCAWTVSMLVGYMPFVGARLSPQAINPYRTPGSGSQVDEVKAFIASMAWHAIAG